MIFVPHDAEGFTITPIDTMGGEETNELHLDDVRVPEDALLGTEGNGWIQLMAGLNYERTILAATSLGLAQRAFDDTLAYVKERKQFGRPVGSLPGAPAPDRRHGHRDRPGSAAGALGGAADRRGPVADASPGGVDGQAGRHRAGEEGRPRGGPDGGRLRLRHRVPDGAPPAQRPWSPRSTAARRRSSATSSPRRSVSSAPREAAARGRRKGLGQDYAAPISSTPTLSRPTVSTPCSRPAARFPRRVRGPRRWTP